MIGVGNYSISVNHPRPKTFGPPLLALRTCYQMSLSDDGESSGSPGRCPQFHPQHLHSRMASYLMKPRNTSSTRLTSHPAVAKALGMVSAPVPTMRLNIYTSPTWNRESQHLSPEIDKPYHPQGLPRVTLGDDKTRGDQEALARRARKKGGLLSGSREAGSAAGCWATKARGPPVFSECLWGSVSPSSFAPSPPSLHQCVLFGAAS